MLGVWAHEWRRSTGMNGSQHVVVGQEVVKAQVLGCSPESPNSGGISSKLVLGYATPISTSRVSHGVGSRAQARREQPRRPTCAPGPSGEMYETPAWGGATRLVASHAGNGDVRRLDGDVLRTGEAEGGPRGARRDPRGPCHRHRQEQSADDGTPPQPPGPEVPRGRHRHRHGTRRRDDRPGSAPHAPPPPRPGPRGATGSTTRVPGR